MTRASSALDTSHAREVAQGERLLDRGERELELAQVADRLARIPPQVVGIGTHQPGGHARPLERRHLDGVAPEVAREPDLDGAKAGLQVLAQLRVEGALARLADDGRIAETPLGRRRPHQRLDRNARALAEKIQQCELHRTPRGGVAVDLRAVHVQPFTQRLDAGDLRLPCRPMVHDERERRGDALAGDRLAGTALAVAAQAVAVARRDPQRSRRAALGRRGTERDAIGDFERAGFERAQRHSRQLRGARPRGRAAKIGPGCRSGNFHRRSVPRWPRR